MLQLHDINLRSLKDCNIIGFFPHHMLPQSALYVVVIFFRIASIIFYTNSYLYFKFKRLPAYQLALFLSKIPQKLNILYPEGALYESKVKYRTNCVSQECGVLVDMLIALHQTILRQTIHYLPLTVQYFECVVFSLCIVTSFSSPAPRRMSFSGSYITLAMLLQNTYKHFLCNNTLCFFPTQLLQYLPYAAP